MELLSATVHFGGFPLLLLSLLIRRPRSEVRMVLGWLATVVAALPWFFSVLFVVVKVQDEHAERIREAILALDGRAPLALLWWVSALAGLIALIVLFGKLTREVGGDRRFTGV